jgi:hypothetical protein
VFKHINLRQRKFYKGIYYASKEEEGHKKDIRKYSLIRNSGFKEYIDNKPKYEDNTEIFKRKVLNFIFHKIDYKQLDHDD